MPKYCAIQLFCKVPRFLLMETPVVRVSLLPFGRQDFAARPKY